VEAKAEGAAGKAAAMPKTRNHANPKVYEYMSPNSYAAAALPYLPYNSDTMCKMFAPAGNGRLIEVYWSSS
jgi:hypothetical protein